MFERLRSAVFGAKHNANDDELDEISSDQMNDYVMSEIGYEFYYTQYLCYKGLLHFNDSLIIGFSL